MEITEWLDSLEDSWSVFAKRLSGNDTGLTGSHQVGFYLPKEVGFQLIPDLEGPPGTNPDVLLETVVDPVGDHRTIRAVWYNSGTRDEIRLTRWGGALSPLQNPENTGALLLVAFRAWGSVSAPPRCRVWLSRTPAEEDIASAWLGEPVEPGAWVLVSARNVERREPRERQEITQGDIPRQWWTEFPTGDDILAFVVDSLPAATGLEVDRRLLKRRELEFHVFGLVEKIHLLPRVADGFNAVDEFLAVAHSVTNRRKSRAGRSLELHLRHIFREEGVEFSHGAVIDGGKRPDFLFPGVGAYEDSRFPADRLRMLGVKTTLKDRWRQILNEASRIDAKHLFTLQEGVSVPQHGEMKESGLQLVTPSSLHGRFPQEVRGEILSLSSFIESVRAL